MLIKHVSLPVPPLSAIANNARLLQYSKAEVKSVLQEVTDRYRLMIGEFYKVVGHFRTFQALNRVKDYINVTYLKIHGWMDLGFCHMQYNFDRNTVC